MNGAVIVAVGVIDAVIVAALVSGNEAVGVAALRLANEVLAFLRGHKPDVDPIPDLVRALSDGTLERHLAS